MTIISAIIGDAYWIWSWNGRDAPSFISMEVVCSCYKMRFTQHQCHSGIVRASSALATHRTWARGRSRAFVCPSDLMHPAEVMPMCICSQIQNLVCCRMLLLVLWSLFTSVPSNFQIYFLLLLHFWSLGSVQSWVPDIRTIMMSTVALSLKFFLQC